ncbi:MAG: hypothetical protein JWP63_1295 [Candidatus Solibacter sp.]|nr:hypothetical protein [Candidatus Solibacter sp.]
MNHYSTEDWSDFARGRVFGGLAPDMGRHLVDCDACAGVLAMWRTVLDLAGREAGFAPSKSAVRCAKALFAATPTPNFSGGLVVRVARLVSSVSAQLAPAGVRSHGMAATHLLFRDGRWMLDLRVNARPESDAITVTGQMLDQLEPDRVYTGSLIRILRDDGSTELSRTSANQFGEFELKFPGGYPRLVTVNVARETLLVLPFPVMMAAKNRAEEPDTQYS